MVNNVFYEDHTLLNGLEDGKSAFKETWRSKLTYKSTPNMMIPMISGVSKRTEKMKKHSEFISRAIYREDHQNL